MGAELRVQHSDILIVGGGIAGLGLAASLASRHAGSLRLVDREPQPGCYASGHNAAIARQLTGNAGHTTLTVEGVGRMRNSGLLLASGGLLLEAADGGLDPLESEARAFAVAAERGPGCPLDGLAGVGHLRVPSDGVIDTDRMLASCAERARVQGAEVSYGVEVKAIHPSVDGFEIETSLGTLRTGILVNAAGAWASRISSMAGGLDLRIRPLRRHLVWSNAAYPSDQPWAWWADRPLYLRPESGGLLLCPCDETEVEPPSVHRQPESDNGVLSQLFASLRELAPSLADQPIVRTWCGLRSFAPDRRFVLGWDPVNPRLFWVAGLGGHGMTSGLAVAERAAQLFLERTEDPLSPGRFRAV
jgi:D-arginine dehydrogenase